MTGSYNAAAGPPLRPRRPRVGGTHDWQLQRREPVRLSVPTDPVSVERMTGSYTPRPGPPLPSPPTPCRWNACLAPTGSEPAQPSPSPPTPCRWNDDWQLRRRAPVAPCLNRCACGLAPDHVFHRHGAGGEPIQPHFLPGLQSWLPPTRGRWGADATAPLCLAVYRYVSGTREAAQAGKASGGLAVGQPRDATSRRRRSTGLGRHCPEMKVQTPPPAEEPG